MSIDQSTLFLKIGTGYGLPETYVKQSFLEAYGYTVLNFNSYNMALSPHHVHAIEGMTLYIPEDEIEDALALLESVEEDTSIMSFYRSIICLMCFFFSNFYISNRAIGFFASSPNQLRSILYERKIIRQQDVPKE